MAKKIGGLGKGLSAIFVENETEDGSEVVILKISQIEPNRKQPRRIFSDEALGELAQSIAEHGVLQPILVRPMLHGGYQIVAGERRYRAARLAGLTEVPVIIREMTDSEAMELALIENLQREDLSPLEEAAGYKTLIDEYGFTQDDVARTVGKSRSAVANMLRLLTLPDEVQDMVNAGRLSAGHARALLPIEDKENLVFAARKAADGGMTVRETEKAAKKLSAPKKPAKQSAPRVPVVFKELELSIAEELGTKVRVIPGKKAGQGTLCIEFYSPQEMLALAARLTDSWKDDMD